MKFRNVLLLLAAAALVAVGCGSDSKSKSGDSKPQTKAEKERAKDAKVKDENLDKAKAAFEKDAKDVGTCRNLAMAWINKASPASQTDPKAEIVYPKGREKSLESAIETLEGCAKLDKDDRDVKRMLSSTYMSPVVNEPKKAMPILEQLARSAEGPERPNAYYAWGLAANRAQDYDQAVTAWQQFLRVAPKNDTRIKQVRESVKALSAAAKAQKAAAAKEKKDDSGS